jgi:hypothetical protein
VLVSAIVPTLLIGPPDSPVPVFTRDTVPVLVAAIVATPLAIVRAIPVLGTMSRMPVFTRRMLPVDPRADPDRW